MAKGLRVSVMPISTGRMTLPKEAAHYVSRVHRLRPGASLELFDPLEGLVAEAVLLEVSRGGVVCEVGALTPVVDAHRLPVLLAQALGKADKPDRVVKDATALGVQAVYWLATERVVQRVQAEAWAERMKRLEAIAIDAARQCGRERIPCLSGPLSLVEWLELERAAGRAERWFLLDPEGEQGLFQALQGMAEPPRDEAPIGVLIGPEGGFSPEEREAALRAGVQVVRFGGLILRTETAATAVLGALLAWCDAEAAKG